MHPTAFGTPLIRGLGLGTLVVWAGFEIRQSLRTREGTTPATGGATSALVVRVGGVIGIVAATQLRVRLPGADVRFPTVTSWLGLAAVWLGVGLRLWCFRTLGQYFTFVIQTGPDQPVVTTGPYRVVRHPSYAALLLVFMGIGLLLGNWVSFLVLTLTVGAALVHRIRLEDEVLLRELGPDYRAYAESHKRLVPGVW